MTATSTSNHRAPFLLAPIAILLLAISGCDMAHNTGEESQSDAPESPDSRNWKLVQAYNDLDDAWHARDREISGSEDTSSEEKDRLRKEERGEHPDIVLAVVAARALAGGDSEHAFDAAKFLLQATQDLSPTASADKEFGNAAMVRLIGPDWSAVEAYNDAYAEWKEDDEKRREEFRSQEEGSGKPFVIVRPPDALRALAAAQAILEAGSGQENAQDAAKFLVENGRQYPHAMLSGARVLAASSAGYDDWPTLLMRIGDAQPAGTSESVDEFLAEMASQADDPVVRATARFFHAKGLANSVNQPSMESEERGTLREQALEIATGLSAGVEAESFVKTVTVDGEKVNPTLAEAESALVHGIRHTVVGATVADEPGIRLDGTDDALSVYGGKVVLMDFWATWCGPCIASLPQMRGISEEYAEDEFTILGISVDAEVETVTDFMEDQPMPWEHWHIGVGSEMDMKWDIPGFPTYVVVDKDGVILSRGHSLDAAAKAIEQAVNGEA